MSSRKGPLDPPLKTIFLTFVIFCALVLLFTALGVFLGPPAAQVGGTRPAETIPSHLAELAGFGLVLGIGSAVIYGRNGIGFVFLTPLLVLSLDLDHLPAYLGMAQTIRPAHSLVFIVAIVTVTAITIKRLDVDLVVLSATLAHMGIDTGLFAPFSPVNFEYIQLDPYSIPFLLGAVLAAVAAGIVLRQRQSKYRISSSVATSNA